jgi:hypothetical protein
LATAFAVFLVVPALGIKDNDAEDVWGGGRKDSKVAETVG